MNNSVWRTQFAAHVARAREPADITEARRRAFDWFLAHGFPTTRDEDWKYSDVTALVSRNWTEDRPPSSREAVVGPEDLPQELLAISPHRLVFVNGALAENLSAPLPSGLRVEPVGDAIARDARARDAFAGPDEPPSNRATDPLADAPANAPANAFDALNLALAEAGLAIEAHDTTRAPLHILHVASGASDSAATLRHVVVAEPGSSLDLIETHVALDDADTLFNATMQIVVEHGAALRHWQIALRGGGARRILRTNVILGDDARYEHASIVLGGAFTRADVNVTLGNGAACALHGLRILQDREHADHALRVVHRGVHAQSGTVFRTVVDDEARGAVSARAQVAAGAHGADARQDLRNLLLSPSAEADSRPQLEIYADDVQCRHGAATGNLDPEAIYYLRTRGLDERAARAALLQAFVRQVVAAIAFEPLQRLVEAEMAKRLEGE
jgi:Fe-S cluster assembly protein SufD